MVLGPKILKKGQGKYIFFNFFRKIPNTIVVIKTNFNKIIGGFTPLKWNNPKIENHEYIYTIGSILLCMYNQKLQM